MSQKYGKMQMLLKELFQLDQPDLDFGLLRVTDSKSTEVSQFLLHQDLFPQVKDYPAPLRNCQQDGIGDRTLGIDRWYGKGKT